MRLKHSPLSYIPKVIFILAWIFTCVITYFITQDCIDADASSELVLANHLAETGQILSTDWIYSTELRVFNTQLVYAPLFLIFSSWHLVRYVGSLILQGLLVLCLYVLFRLVRLDKNAFYISAALLLLPVSVCYGRIILYNCYYIPHLCLSLLIVGLTFRAKENNSKKVLRYIEFFLLLVFSFLGGLGGIRQLLMTHAPILLAIFLFSFMDDMRGEKTASIFKKSHLILWARGGLSAVCFLIGFLINKFYLMDIYTFADFSENTVKLLPTDKWNSVLYGLLHHFGFREDVSLLSVLGVLSALSILLCIYCLIVAVRRLLSYRKNRNMQDVVISAFFVSYVFVMAFVFLLIGDGFYHVLYFSPIVVWMIPVFVLHARRLPKGLPIFNLQRVIAYLAMIVIALNGAVNTVYFLSDTHFQQKYEGLVYQNKSRKAEMTDVADFLVREGFELGYATFWNSNILTEITDNQVKTINIDLNHDTGSINYYDWLTLKSNRTMQAEKKFLLLESGSQSAAFEAHNDTADCVLVYADPFFQVYRVP